MINCILKRKINIIIKDLINPDIKLIVFTKQKWNKSSNDNKFLIVINAYYKYPYIKYLYSKKVTKRITRKLGLKDNEVYDVIINSIGGSWRQKNTWNKSSFFCGGKYWISIERFSYKMKSVSESYTSGFHRKHDSLGTTFYSVVWNDFRITLAKYKKQSSINEKN